MSQKWSELFVAKARIDIHWSLPTTHRPDITKVKTTLGWEPKVRTRAVACTDGHIILCLRSNRLTIL
jgi:hypothetical protein